MGFSIFVLCAICARLSPKGGVMSEAGSAMHSEDIDLDEGGAEAVLGGAAKPMTLEQALKAGYTEVACKPHGTLVKNMKTGKEMTIPYK
jgi:hypothetical protein